MAIVPLLVLCSLALAACGAALFVFSARNRDHEHVDRLSLLPLEDDLERDAQSLSHFVEARLESRSSGTGAWQSGSAPEVDPHG